MRCACPTTTKEEREILRIANRTVVVAPPFQRDSTRQYTIMILESELIMINENNIDSS